MFPNHIPNPEDKDAMKSITQAVLGNKADLGIIFDTELQTLTGSGLLHFKCYPDCRPVEFVSWLLVSPRSAAVDSNGRELNSNRLIALMSVIVLEEVWYSFSLIIRMNLFLIFVWTCSFFTSYWSPIFLHFATSTLEQLLSRIVLPLMDWPHLLRKSLVWAHLDLFIASSFYCDVSFKLNYCFPRPN